MELYLLARYFNLSVWEANFQVPAWYRDMLLRRLVEHETGEGKSAPSGNAFDSVPEELQGLG